MSTSSQHGGQAGEGTLVIIPAMLSAAGLPGKALADIGGEPLVVRVWRAAVSARVGRVVVVSPDPDVARAVTSFGGQGISLAPGSVGLMELAQAALHKTDAAGACSNVLVVRADYPQIAPRCLQRVLAPLQDAVVDIATLAAPITEDADKANPSLVKAALKVTPGSTIARVTDFYRLPPEGRTGTEFVHVDVCAFRRTVLENFVLLPPSVRETQQKYELMRALDVGMRMDAALIERAPMRVTTPADLEQARAEVSGADG